MKSDNTTCFDCEFSPAEKTKNINDLKCIKGYMFFLKKTKKTWQEYKLINQYKSCHDFKPKQEDKMPTKKEIVKACDESIKKYQEWITGKGVVGMRDDCSLCVLYGKDCDACVFPNCLHGNDTSFRRLAGHWNNEHKEFYNNQGSPKCVGKCCVEHGKAVIADLERIKADNSEEERTYSIGDRFKTECSDSMLLACAGSGNGVVLVDLETGKYGSCRITVSNVNSITKQEVGRLSNFKPVHISGPTYIEENKCKHGFEFGRDYWECGDECGDECDGGSPEMYNKDTELWDQCQELTDEQESKKGKK